MAIKLVKDVSGKGTFNETFVVKVNKLQELFKAKYGHYFVYKSTYRSTEKQKQLYALYLAGKGNIAAKPGTSRHEHGAAFDSGENKAMATNKWFLDTAKECGIINFPKEKWHYSDTGR